MAGQVGVVYAYTHAQYGSTPHNGMGVAKANNPQQLL